MRLWLTRDDNRTKKVLVIACNDKPLFDGKMFYVGDESRATIMIIDGTDVDLPPGTCTELFTEKQVRERVAKAVNKAFLDEEIYCAACDYLNEPTDDNWARLMAEVGAGGEA